MMSAAVALPGLAVPVAVQGVTTAGKVDVAVVVHAAAKADAAVGVVAAAAGMSAALAVDRHAAAAAAQAKAAAGVQAAAKSAAAAAGLAAAQTSAPLGAAVLVLAVRTPQDAVRAGATAAILAADGSAMGAGGDAAASCAMTQQPCSCECRMGHTERIRVRNCTEPSNQGSRRNHVAALFYIQLHMDSSTR
jgi:hypothetical protein